MFDYHIATQRVFKVRLIRWTDDHGNIQLGSELSVQLANPNYSLVELWPTKELVHAPKDKLEERQYRTD